jgi:argininosuccinate lyase
VGPVGGKLHTGRSRNDQVALDERLYLRGRIGLIADALRDMQRVLLAKAREYNGVVMPGYTHLQRAQPILLAHHLIAYIEMLDRDHGRLGDAAARMNLSPLGAAALAGTSFPLDRAMVASALGFDGIVANSIDAVSDRDYLIELASACSIIMMHLSRLAEELVIWSTREFGFVTIGDAYTTGSSIMPQKKNPDMAELVRGKTGRVYGDLVNLLTIMKGLPLAYNRDMQEDKMPMLDAVGTTLSSIGIMARMLETVTFDRERLAAATEEDYLAATELADYLVRKGIPFRDAHANVGRIVAHCDQQGARLHDLDHETLRTFSSAIESDLVDTLEPSRSIHMKRTAGSSSPSEVDAQIERWETRLA